MSDKNLVEDLTRHLERLAVKPSQKLLTSASWNDLKREQSKLLQNFAKAHIDSFNFMVNEGIEKGIQNLQPLGFELSTGDRVVIQIMSCSISSPMISMEDRMGAVKLYPAEVEALIVL